MINFLCIELPGVFDDVIPGSYDCIYYYITERSVDIMGLASPPRPPVDPDDVNTLTRQIFNLSLLYEGRYPPKVLCYEGRYPPKVLCY